jgi:hypothetical protein
MTPQGLPIRALYLEPSIPSLSPSSRGPGYGPFKAETRVRIPLGTPIQNRTRAITPFWSRPSQGEIAIRGV